MDSKAIAVTAVFVALTIALNLSPIKIPAPYAPFLIYQIWEIPIVAAFLLYGPRIGVSISVVNTLLLLGIFPGELPTGPFYNLAAILSMLFGIHLVRGISAVRVRMIEISGLIATALAVAAIYAAFQQNLFGVSIGLVFVELVSWIIFLGAILTTRFGKRQEAMLLASTAVGVAFRVGLMTIVNWAFLPFPPPVGFGFPAGMVVAILPVIGVFNASLALYTIPVGHLLARAVSSSLKTVGWGQEYSGKNIEKASSL
ncbi:MAG: hypothetical protein NWE81_04455 [Candidatus Bathyarchaeota archaeon]|nr:hypothetical protein [Candidatus Bathyarchaeota archaeon]